MDGTGSKKGLRMNQNRAGTRTAKRKKKTESGRGFGPSTIMASSSSRSCRLKVFVDVFHVSRPLDLSGSQTLSRTFQRSNSRRPPPAIPSSESLTTAPSSPLLCPPVQPQDTTSLTDPSLPPVSRPSLIPKTSHRTPKRQE